MDRRYRRSAASSCNEITWYDSFVFANTKAFAFIFNECSNGRGKRVLEYVDQLMLYLPIHSHGKCKNNQDSSNWEGSIESIMARKIQIYKKYKFVLVFEAYNEIDYVTEDLLAAFLVKPHIFYFS